MIPGSNPLNKFEYEPSRWADSTDANVISSSKVFPHPCPRALYIFGPANESKAPLRLLSTVFAAVALTAYGVNASTKYVVIGMKDVITPIPKSTWPSKGMIQAPAH